MSAPKITRESAIGRIAMRFRSFTGERPDNLEEAIRIYHRRVCPLRLTAMARAERVVDIVHDICGILGTFNGTTDEHWSPRFAAER